ncbi:hypothetical protein PTKIN_Ptkin16aG0472600 [Pterospermum kingtungense]
MKKIPLKFNSAADYLNAFVAPLIEETHAELLSGMTTLSRAHSPSRQLYSVEEDKNYKPPRDLLYQIVLRNEDSNKSHDLETYEPQAGDVVALTDVRPRRIDDLKSFKMSYLLAYVQSVDCDDAAQLSILSSKPIMVEQEMQRRKKHTLFLVYLMNMTTNIRIWNALHPNPKGGNLKMINKIVQMNGADEKEDCAMCLSEKNSGTNINLSFKSYGSNDSQEAAIISCINTWRCRHQNTVKLVWGPPGTGKTKTVSLLLCTLLRMKCRTITCAPTNTAVVEVASRLFKLVTDMTLGYDTYGLGDIVLFGHRERMKIDDHDDLLNVFLDHRVEMLCQCLSPISGWKTSLASMIDFLEDFEVQYSDVGSTNLKMVGENLDEKLKDKKSKSAWKKVRKESKKKLGEFVKKRFSLLNERLKFCAVNLYTHLPTHVISLELVKNMTLSLQLLTSLETLLKKGALDDDTVKISEVGVVEKFSLTRKICLRTLKSLPRSFPVPDFQRKFLIKKFCLDNACLLFCTVSSSSKLNTGRTQPLDLLVIDEAAQLKESESTIPFQLRGLRHAVLIGDECQLPAMIHSKVSGEAEFGRSLFERLVLLGHKKQLLNVQYRMHPAISSFPNKEFYDGKILDAPGVKTKSHGRRYLQGNMYGAYSFINVSRAKEQLDHRHSWKNMVEVAVVCKIVDSLFEEFSRRKQRISIGIISPYKAQVHEIQDKLEKKYIGSAESGFAVSIRSVDGFQGGEEDVIIISTVRCNIKGLVGFLSNRQRANVALTRARHCLWILGNEATFVKTKSDSIWKKLVADAKKRGCFFNAEEDKNLAEAVVTALIDLKQFDTLLCMYSLQFKETRWRVCYSNDLWKSMARIKKTESHKQLTNLLEKLSSGWRQTAKQNNSIAAYGSLGLLEVYPVDGFLNLLWSIDIIKEKSNFIQVLKVWDILPLMDIPKVTKKIKTLFGGYTVDKLSRCKSRSLQGNLVVPMRWSVDRGRIGSDGHEDETLQRLSTPFSSLSLVDD